MCLLMKVSKDSRFSTEFLTDVYNNNSDGLGIMWHDENNQLHCVKIIPKNAKQATKFFRQHAEGKDCIVHYRFTTHGETRADNTHPYPVMGVEGAPEHEVAMMLAHNGILSTGNAKDPSRSDTYHYINDYLYPLLNKNPDLILEPAFINMVNSHIGSSNKFAIMDNRGNTVLFNEDAFVKYEGSLLSNTYAYNAVKFGVAKPTYYGGYGGYKGYGAGYGWGAYEDDYYEPVGKKTASFNTLTPYDDDSIEMQYAELFMDTLQKRRYYESYSTLTHEELADYYREDPYEAEDLLLALEDGEISDVQILELFDGISYNNYMNADAVNDKVAA